MSEANKELVRRFYAAGTGDLAGIEGIVAEDYFDHHFLPGMPRGPEGVRQWFSAVLGSVFSEMRIEIDRMIAEGDWVDCHFALLCKHTADFGDLKAKGNALRIPASWRRAGSSTTAATWPGRCRRESRIWIRGFSR
jgi:predicted SnoaL-like aldol condensation-catalyzing enzyme